MITRLVATYATSKRDSISDVFTNEPGESDKEVLDRNILIRDSCAGIHEAPPEERTALYTLETAQAFRTVHANSVAEHAKRGGLTPKEDWGKDDHAIILPIQCIKAAGSEIHGFELRLIDRTLIYRPNLSKTTAEAEALRKLMAPPNKSRGPSRSATSSRPFP